jgi:hypothetical protein
VARREHIFYFSGLLCVRCCTARGGGGRDGLGRGDLHTKKRSLNPKQRTPCFAQHSQQKAAQAAFLCGCLRCLPAALTAGERTEGKEKITLKCDGWLWRSSLLGSLAYSPFASDLRYQTSRCSGELSAASKPETGCEKERRADSCPVICLFEPGLQKSGRARVPDTKGGHLQLQDDNQREHSLQGDVTALMSVLSQSPHLNFDITHQ